MYASNPFWCYSLLDDLQVTGPLPFEVKGPGCLRVPDLGQGRTDWKWKWDDAEFRQYVAKDLHFDPERKLEYGTRFRSEWRKGDQVFHWTTPRITWMTLCGRAGYAHVRNGKVLDSILTSLN
jgi:hypothetical protein